MAPKQRKGKSKECEVCSFLFVSDLTKSCNHMCASCELTLMECPICIATQIEARKVNDIELPKENLDDIVGSILKHQNKSAELEDANRDLSLAKSTQRQKPNFQAQILRQCFLGIWDGTVGSLLGALGFKKSAKTSIVAKNVNNVMKRVGRQSGRTVFSQISAGNGTSSSSMVKVIGGLAAALICVQIFARKSGNQ